MRIVGWGTNRVSGIHQGTAVLVAAGERIPVDGVVDLGASDLDCSVVAGDSAPRVVAPDDRVQSDVMNLMGLLAVRATVRAEDSFLAEIVRQPAVHTLAPLSILAWFSLIGDWRTGPSPSRS